MDIVYNNIKEKILNEIKRKSEVILEDNDDPKMLFNELKTDLLSSYMKNDFRVSVLKKFASKLLAIIELTEMADSNMGE